MGFIIKKQKGIIFTKILKLATVIFIVSFGFSVADALWAVYLDSFFHSASIVGFLSAFLAVFSFFSFFLIVPLIEKSDKAKIFSISLLMIAVSYFVFTITSNIYLFLGVTILLAFFNTLRITSFGLLVNDKSNHRKLARNEGLMYTFMNTAWFLGPLIAGILSKYFKIRIVFGLSGIFIIIALIYFLFLKFNDRKVRKRIDKSMTKVFRDFFKNKERTIAYFLGGGVNYWWSLIYIFIPLYIIKNGISLSYVGYFLFAVATPLIAFSYFFSNLAGKVGFKKIFKIGYLIVALASLACFFIPNVYIILLTLVFASIGMAMLEATTEAYFFDVLKGKEELRFYGPYNTTIDVNHFISRGVGGVILLFLPFQFIFLFFSLSMLVFFFLSFKVKNIKENRRGIKYK